MEYDVIFPHLGIEIEELPRVAFTVFGVEIYFYGVCIGLAFLIGTLYALHEAKRTNQNQDDYLDVLIFGIPACIIGARLYYVIFSWDTYKDNLLSIFDIRAGGLAIYGGIIAAMITGLIFTRVRKLNFYTYVDTVMPAIILGQAIGRWGNFFNREAFGGYTDSLFAMQYLAEEVGYIPTEVMNSAVMVNGAQYIQVHPTFLYESFWCILVFIALNIIKHHKKFEGQIFALYFVGYGLGRFFIESLRTDQLFLWRTSIPVSQLLSLCFVVFGVVFIIVNLRRSKKIKEDVL